MVKNFLLSADFTVAVSTMEGFILYFVKFVGTSIKCSKLVPEKYKLTTLKSFYLSQLLLVSW